MKIDFTGKTIVVTGATGQLGRTIARTFGDCGANVVVHYIRNQAKAQELVQELTAKGVRCMAVQADITDSASVHNMKAEILHTFDAVDIIVNNAVSQYKWTTILDQPVEHFIDQFQTCTLQGVHMAKAFLPDMIARKAGRFIGINTECAALLKAGSGAYAAAKRGMDGLYRVLAREVGSSGVTVNQVAPGWTISDNDRENHTEIAPEYAKDVPLARRGTDQEIANAVAFLASDLASFITGVYLPVTGGTVMPGI